MSLIYIAHPIDNTTPGVRTKVSGALAALGGGRAHLNGNHLYLPSSAFQIGPGCKPDQTINRINEVALFQAEMLLALWPSGARSWGVPIEADYAIKEGKRVALVVEDVTTWAMQYDGPYVEVFKVDPREYDGFTMAALRAMDWLTGYERDERTIYKPPAEATDAVAQTKMSADRAQFERGKVEHVNISPILLNHHPASIVTGGRQGGKSAHLVVDGTLAYPTSEAQFLGYAASDGPSEALTEPETDEKPENGPEDKEDPTEPLEIGFRNLQYTHDADALAKLPTRGYASDAGLDIFVSEDTVVEPGTFADIRSHVAVNLPKDTWAYLVGRSSTLRKKGLLVNPGVIDNGYTGELYSAVWNLTGQPVKVHAGERIAQLILMPNITPGFQPMWTTAAELSERGAQGFGSSGV